MTAKMTYTCQYTTILTDEFWDQLPVMTLHETVTSLKPRLQTLVKACWTADNVCFRFECEDDYIVATYTLRDDPLYLEDVVEIFIDEAGDGRHYMEYEVSPHNVLFDGLIDNDLAGTVLLNKEWNAAGIQTAVDQINANTYIYSINIPHAVFTSKLARGLEWHVNFYRIDDTPDGTRHYWAWSPTGIVNFHLPAFFGKFIFA